MPENFTEMDEIGQELSQEQNVGGVNSNKAEPIQKELIVDELRELPKISEVGRGEDDERLRALVDLDTEDGWKAVMATITDEIAKKPEWLLDSKMFDEFEIEYNQRLLNNIQQDELKSLGDLQGRMVTKSVNAYIVRFFEIFSEKYNFPYVWRGGSLDELKKPIKGTYTFFIGVAKDNVMSSTYSGQRSNPGLIGLPVSAIVEDFKRSKNSQNIFAEHGYDEIISTSFDLYLSSPAPRGTIAYSPD